jgi:hypothetical protein
LRDHQFANLVHHRIESVGRNAHGFDLARGGGTVLRSACRPGRGGVIVDMGR